MYFEIKKNSLKLEKFLDTDTLRAFESFSYEELYELHFGFDIWIRNNLLKENDLLFQLFQKGRVKHKDDMSELFIELFFVYMHLKSS